MESIIKRFKQIFQFLIETIKDAFLKSTISLKKGNGSFFKKTSIMIPFLICLIVSSFGISTFLPSNKTNSINRVAQLYSKNGNDLPKGVIYLERVNDRIWDIEIRNVSLTKQIRDTYPENFILDSYIANNEHTISPSYYVDSLSNKHHRSLLLFPKTQYTSPTFFYDIPLSYGSIPQLASLEDLYIDVNYADYLLSANPSLAGYQSLINYPTTLNSCRGSFVSTNHFIIRGIIDPLSEQYIKCKKLFGDFFIVNDFYTLNMNGYTLFELSGISHRDRQYINNLLKVFKYNTSVVANGSIEEKLYEYRISFLNKENENYSSIIDCGKALTEYDRLCNEIFDLFEINFIAYLITFILFNLLGVVGLFFAVKDMKKTLIETGQIDNNSIPICQIIIILVTLLICAIIGYLIYVLLSKFFSPFTFLWPFHYWSIIIIAIEIGLLFLRYIFSLRNK